MVQSYAEEEGLSTPDAAALVREDQLGDEQRALRGPPDEVSWADLEGLLQRDPQTFQQRWEEIKGAAREELLSGHRACQPVEVHGATPWKRARFLALRLELADGWQPRNGVELQLVDMMAQAQTASEYWQKALASKAALEAGMEKATLLEKAKWEPPRVSGFQAVEQAGAMVDRFNRIFLRTLRALQDLRRRGPAVVVHNVGRVRIEELQANPRNGDANSERHAGRPRVNPDRPPGLT
jgi:hypothetical protein